MPAPFKFVHATVLLLLRFGGFYQKNLKYSLATSWEMQVIVVAKGTSGIETVQGSSFVPRFSMALLSLAKKCKLHHELIVIMKRHGVNHSSHGQLLTSDFPRPVSQFHGQFSQHQLSMKQQLPGRHHRCIDMHGWLEQGHLILPLLHKVGKIEPAKPRALSCVRWIPCGNPSKYGCFWSFPEAQRE